MADPGVSAIGGSGRLWAYLTLARPANVVTALADVGAGTAAAGTLAGLPGLLAGLAADLDAELVVDEPPELRDAVRALGRRLAAA